MPGKRQNKKTNATRNVRQRRRRFVPRGTGHVMPNQWRTRVAYSVNYVASAAGTLSPNTGFFQFTGNSVYNPDLQTLVERFPIGIAQFSHLYQRYYVEACSMRVSAQPIAGVTTAEAHWVLVAHPYTNTIPTGATVVTDFVGQPYSSRLLTVGPISNVVTTQRKYRSSTVFSRPESQIHNSEPTSGFLNSITYQPIDQWFWTLVFTNSTASASLPAISFNFTMEFDVVLFQNGWANLATTSPGAFVEITPESDYCVCPPPPEESKDPVEVAGAVAVPVVH